MRREKDRKSFNSKSQYYTLMLKKSLYKRGKRREGGGGRMSKTVIFEEKYGVNVDDFSTTEEIDEVIEKQKGRKLEIVKIDDHGIVPSRGNVFKISKAKK